MIRRSHIVLDELDREGAIADVSDDQAALLRSSRLVEVRPDRSGWRLVPRGTVGSARVGEVQVDVRPKEKVGLDRLLFLLGYAKDPGFRPELVSASRDADLWPALAESLIRLVRIALGPGVLQGYRTVDQALRTVRGRIRIGDQIRRRPGQMIPIEVTHTEFSADIPENQILRTALRRMLVVPRLSGAARASLGHMDGQLAGVTILPSGTNLPDWPSTRLNQRYTPALRLAEIILANASTETGPGHLQMAAFVVDLARVYEDFVATAIREALADYPGDTRSQYRARLDENDYTGPPGIPMYLDVVHLVDKIPRLVFDAKYKAADQGGQYPNADHYQMLAYCTALQVHTAWLVYAGHGQTRHRRVVHTPTTIVEYPLDLSAEPLALLANVNALVAAACASGNLISCSTPAGELQLPKLPTTAAESKGTGNDGEWFAASDFQRKV